MTAKEYLNTVQIVVNEFKAIDNNGNEISLADLMDGFAAKKKEEENKLSSLPIDVQLMFLQSQAKYK